MILLFLFGKMTNLLRTDQVCFMGHFPKGRWFKLEKMERKGIGYLKLPKISQIPEGDLLTRSSKMVWGDFERAENIQSY